MGSFETARISGHPKDVRYHPQNGRLKARASTLCVRVPPAPRPNILSLDFILEGPRYDFARGDHSRQHRSWRERRDTMMRLSRAAHRQRIDA